MSSVIRYIYPMSDTITYTYPSPSRLLRSAAEDSLFLSQYAEVRQQDAPCFFWGRLTDPYITARCLITLSNVVQSSFSLSPADLAKIKDPIVTTGAGKIRFEGFSQCAGVYARVDVLPEGHDGEFPANGTTNVDFNQPMITALSGIRRSEQVLLSVGQREVAVQNEGGKVVERKVPLPSKWIKGLASVQVFLSQVEKDLVFTRMQALQLFQTLPTGKPKEDFFLTVRGSRPIFSTVGNPGAVTIGGVHRLRLLEPLLPLITELRVFPHPDHQSTSWQLYFGGRIRFSLTLSRDAWRGFSGEGATLEGLLEEPSEEWLDAFDNYSFANQTFNPALTAVEEDLNPVTIANLCARLSAMGLLGYDLDENQFFYRRLPYKLSRILSLNPRLKDAEKLLAENKVSIVAVTGDRVEARVAGSGVQHTVVIEGDRHRCTCTWYSRHQGERGPCKHVLAVKKKLIS
jgi:hypothetical protein